MLFVVNAKEMPLLTEREVFVKPVEKSISTAYAHTCNRSTKALCDFIMVKKLCAISVLTKVFLSFSVLYYFNFDFVTVFFSSFFSFTTFPQVVFVAYFVLFSGNALLIHAFRHFVHRP